MEERRPQVYRDPRPAEYFTRFHERARSRELGHAKPGVGRLALETGVPVIPVAIHGSAGVRGWKRLRFPRVTVQYGEPLRFPVEEDAPRERHREVSDEVFARVREMYAALESEGRGAVARRAPTSRG